MTDVVSLSETDLAHIGQIVTAVTNGRLTDASIEASLGASDTTDEFARTRFARLASATWEARAYLQGAEHHAPLVAQLRGRIAQLEETVRAQSAIIASLRMSTV